MQIAWNPKIRLLIRLDPCYLGIRDIYDNFYRRIDTNEPGSGK